MKKYIQELYETEAEEVVTWTVASGAFPPGTYSVTRRKLTIHILLHELRHLAQIAYAARAAGQAPPGEHDYFYYPEG